MQQGCIFLLIILSLTFEVFAAFPRPNGSSHSLNDHASTTLYSQYTKYYASLCLNGTDFLFALVSE
jgi:hypothetical protein